MVACGFVKNIKFSNTFSNSFVIIFSTIFFYLQRNSKIIILSNFRETLS